MGFSEAVKTCFLKYFTFNGRAQRSEFWWFVLFGKAIIILLTLVFDDVAIDSVPVAGGVFSLVIVMPFLAVCVRRLHDINLSGWWALLNLLPFVGYISVLIVCTVPGTEDANRFGNPVRGTTPV
ncbi:MAG: DUF805 domain-containing protein [Rhodobacteraceae bacterium]|nr:DUF805 domain-containing protein [Paracoccaceae bacterium]